MAPNPEKLFDNELLFQSRLLNTIQQAVIVTKLDGSIIYWNDFATKLYGWKKEEVIGQNIIEITPTEISIDEAIHLMDELKQGKSWSGNFLVRHRNGRQFMAKVHNSSMLDANGDLTGIIGVSWDISKELALLEESNFQSINREALINTTSDLMWSVDLEYRFLAGNRNFSNFLEKSLGQTPERGTFILQKGPFNDEYLKFWKGCYDRAFQGEQFRIEVHADAVERIEDRWLDISFNPILQNELVIGAAIYARDITERKRIEESIRKSEERFRLIYDSSPMGIAIIDSLNGRILDANKSFSIITGRSLDLLRTLDWMSITHPEDIAEDMENMSKMNAGLINGFTMEKRYFRPNGSVVWIRMAIAPFELKEDFSPRHLCMIEDITDKKIIEQEIRQSNERYEYVIRATSDAIWDWNIITGKVIRSGTGLETLFGYDSKKVSIDPEFWKKHVHPEDLERVLEKRINIFNHTKELYWSDEYRFRRSDGTYAYVNDKGFIFRDPQGKAYRMTGATQDISSRKETEIILKDLNEKLEKRALQLELSNAELEQFAHVVSHDLLEPLRMVSSFLGLLEKKYSKQLDETADQYIHFAVDGAKRMKKLIYDLLQYSKVSLMPQNSAETDMSHVIEEVLLNFKPRIDELNAKIRVGKMPLIHNVDHTRMVQLFQNLLSNALKYSGGKTPEISIDAIEKEDEFIFSVADNGIGFDKTMSEKIFIIFQRLHSKDYHSGTGVGLAICKKIIDLYGGKIWVETELEKGSTFYFSIPKNSAHGEDDRN